MLRQRICAGVKEAYLFQKEIIHSDEQATAVIFETQENSCTQKVECIFGLLYKECLSSSKAAKQALFKTLIRIFVSFDADDESNAEDHDVGGVKDRSAKKTKQRLSMNAPMATSNLPFLSYVSQILAHLPYNASMDPLYIVYHVLNAITIHGEPLLYRFARFLAPHLAAFSTVENRECEDINHEKDIIEEAATSETPSRTKAEGLFEKHDFDIDFFAHLCGKAVSIILLIRLQQFLKTVYNLSDARCLEYDPNDKEKVSDRSINIPEEMPLFNNKFEPCVQDTFAKISQSSMAAKKDAVIHVYAEFRHLMRTVGLASVDKKTSKEQ
jgi:cohesin loading factor subunit SCC2